LRHSTYEHLRSSGQIQVTTTRWLATTALEMLGGLQISGAENIANRQGSYVQSSIHRSLLDIPVIGAGAHRADRQQLRFMAKKELNKPVFGKWIGQAGTFYIDREVGLTQADMDYINYLESMAAGIVIFPEGHRNYGPLTKEMLKSLVIVPAVFENGFEVVPVGIDGTQPGDIGAFQIVYGRPIKTEKVNVIEPDTGWNEPKERWVAIKKAAGRDVVRGFMEDLFQGMSGAHLEAQELRQERLTRMQLPPLAVISSCIKFKQKEAPDFRGH
jgi:1-acyl-sn-glycerol-3-phosphate acyltransferase